jgi:uncharacterized protein (DUF58 family)
MSVPAAMIPESVEANARRSKRWGFAFGYRFFLFFLIGIVWLVPAFVDRRFVYAMVAWDLLLILAWAVDLQALPNPEQLHMRRGWGAPLALTVSSQLMLTVENRSDSVLHVHGSDGLPSFLRNSPAEFDVWVPARSEAQRDYSVKPTQRGTMTSSNIYLRYEGKFRLAQRWAMADLHQELTVYPDLHQARRQAVYLIRSRQIALEKRFSRVRGAGKAFESLREYRDGDDFGDICWTATARRGKLITRLYELEKSQTIWLVLDTGRLMRTRIGLLSKLDHAVNAALALAEVALLTGDRVGLLAYARTIRHRVPAMRGSVHLRHFVESLAQVSEDEWEADHLRAAGQLMRDQKRRSLVVWITELAETAMTPEVVEAASKLLPRHLVVFVVIGQPDLQASASHRPESVREMYQVSAAQEVIHRREQQLARLRERGALATEVDSAELAPMLVNSYLHIKQKNQL